MSTFHSISRGSQDPLLVDTFDHLLPPPEASRSSRCGAWAEGALKGAWLVGGVAIRALNYSHWTNALGSLVAGFSIQGLIGCGADEKRLTRIRQVCLTVFGQVPLFALSQAFANTEDEAWKTYLTHAIIAQLGANIQIAAKWLYQEGAIRVESSSAERVIENQREAPCMTRNRSYLLNALAAGGIGVGSHFLSDPILKGFFSFMGSFYATQCIGERGIDWINEQIERSGQAQSISLDESAGTRWRSAKNVITTLSHIGPPLALAPWTTPDTSQRLKQLVFVALSVGLFSGICHGSASARVERLGLEGLQELERLEAPERGESRSDYCRYLAYRVWKYAVPILSIGGITGFTIWQECELDTNQSRISLATMLAGFLVTYSLGKWADETWTINDRSPSKRAVIERIWFSFRFLGINPLFIYYALMNSLRMDSSATDELKNLSVRLLEILAWAGYGSFMARELVVTSSDRIGSAQAKFPLMEFINAVFTTALSARGIDP